MPRIAFVTAIASAALDQDMPLLIDACQRLGLRAEVRAWDDFTVSWARYDAIVLRSTWDYHTRLPEFLRWCERVDRVSRLFNPLPMVRWHAHELLGGFTWSAAWLHLQLAGAIAMMIMPFPTSSGSSPGIGFSSARKSAATSRAMP